MTRLGSRNTVSLALLLPLLVACTALAVVQNLSGRLGFVRLTVHGAETVEDFPRVRTLLDDATRASGLEPGDVLLEAGGRSLRGTGPNGFYARVLEAVPPDRPVPIVFRRGGTILRTTLDVSPPNPQREIRGVLIALSLGLVGTLILLRAPDDHRSYLIFLVTVFYSLNQVWYPGGPPLLTYAWFATFFLGQLVFAPLLVVVAMRWLGRSAHWWEWIVPAVLLLGAPLAHARITGVGIPAITAYKAFLVLDGLLQVVTIAYVVYDVYAADALERRRVKWLVYALYLGLVPVLLVNLLILVDGSWLWVRSYVQHVSLFIPIGLFIAIARYDLFDIDRLIGATVSYTVLVGIFLVFAFTAIPRVAHAMAPPVGIEPDAAQTLLSALLALAMVRGDQRVRPWVDRLFFKERIALERGIEDLLERVDGCRGAQELARVAGEELDSLIRPEVIAIYGRLEDSFSPVFTRGRAVPPAIPAASALIEALEDATAPLDVRTWRRRRGDGRLSPADRAVLETLDAAVLIPARRQGALVAVLCLGRKRSGDIYTTTELALLARVGDRLSSRLERLDLDDVIAQGREMQDSLRRYVPGAVARAIDQSGGLREGKREVSVLFVDIRGYTSLSEGREAEEIFSTINRYTEAVSQQVQAHGGSVVEFNGDGMMAVFGAPTELDAKERASVEAARRIVTQVSELPDGPGGRPLAVGVGIATGPAFVGNVRAVDRLIWSVVGNTTNRAARLQTLSRELEAVVVIDRATQERAGSVARDFEKRPAVPVRGLSERMDLFVLPLDAGASRSGIEISGRAP